VTRKRELLIVLTINRWTQRADEADEFRDAPSFGVVHNNLSRLPKRVCGKDAWIN
jgi:hypothetical protein